MTDDRDYGEKTTAAIDAMIGETVDVVAVHLSLGQIFITMSNGKTIEIFKGEGGELCMELE